MSPVLLALALPSLTLSPTALVTDEDVALDVKLTADVAGARFKLAKEPRRGSATLNEQTGALHYIAWPDYSGSDRIRVEVFAGDHSVVVQIPITVTPVNDPPVVEPLRLTTREERPTDERLKVTDADRDPLVFSVGTAPAHGQATVDEKGRITYAPANDASGHDRFVIVVDDGTVKVEASIDVDIEATNDAPTVAPAKIDGLEDATATVQLVAQDADGDTLTWAWKREPREGSASLDEKTGLLTFRPSPDWHGDTTLTVRVSDGRARADLDIPVHIAPTEDAPRGEPLALRTREDTMVSGALTAADGDGDALVFSLGGPPASGVATIDAQGRVTFTPAPDATGTVAFVAVVDDGHAKIELPVTVVVEPENDAPTLATARIDGTEDRTATVTFVGADIDGDKLTYELRRGPPQGAAVVDAQSGVLTFTPPPDWHGDTTLTVCVSDGRDRIDIEIPVHVDAVDDPPRGEPLSLRTSEDTVASGTLTARDVDGDALAFSLMRRPDSGVATVDAHGRITFTPAPDAAGTFTFVAVVDDGHTKSELPVTVVVEARNDVPTLAPVRIDGVEDRKASVTLVGADIEGDKLTYELPGAPKQGAAVLDAHSGVLTFAPPPDWHGDTTLTVRVSDGRDHVDVDVPVHIDAVDDPPRGQPLTIAAREDTPASGTLTASDVDGDKLVFSLARPPDSGVAVVDAQGRINFTPATDATGTFTLVAVADDGHTRIDIPVTIVVEAENDAPTLATARIDGTEDLKATVTMRGVDVDGDRLSYELRRAPRRGEAVVDAASGQLTYTPEADWNGTVTATVRVSDGRASADVDVPIVIAAVNDAPVVQPLRLETDEDKATGAPLEASDVDRDTLTFAVKAPPLLGEATVDGRGRVGFTPARDKNGTDRFVVAVSDGTTTVDLPVDVRIAAVNDAPASTISPMTFDEDTELRTTLVATDVDGDRLRFRATTAPNAGGRLSLSSSGDLRWSPPPNFHGRDKIGFEVDDGTVKTEVTLGVTVTPTNDAPTLRAKNVSTREDTPTKTDVEFGDIDGDRLTLRIEKQGEKATATVDNAGHVTVTPLRDQWGKDTIVVAVDDGTTTTTDSFTVTIEPTSDPPIVRDELLTTAEDTATETSLPASDPDGDPMTFQLTSTGTLGTARLVDARKGRVAYAPSPDASGEDTIAFVVNDGVDDRQHRVAGRLRIRVTPVDDAPVVAPASMTTEEDTPLRGSVTMTDVDGDALALSVASVPDQATVTIDDAGRGAFVLTPARDFHGEIAFTVVASETAADRLRSAPATVRVTVSARNDAPSTRPVSLQTNEDTPVDGQPRASDIDGDTLRWSVPNQPSGGTVTMDAATGRFTYAPRKNSSGADAFTFVVDDGNGGTATGRVDVVVLPVDDPPVGIPGEIVAPRNGRAAGKLLGRDPEGNPLTFRIVEPPRVGRLTLLDDKTGEYAITIDRGTKGSTAPFRFVVEAGGKTSEPVTVVVRIE